MGGTMVGKSILVATSTTMPTTVSDIPTGICSIDYFRNIKFLLLRSPYMGNSYSSWLVYPSGVVGGNYYDGYNNVYDSYGRFISPNIELSDVPGCITANGEMFIIGWDVIDSYGI